MTPCSDLGFELSVIVNGYGEMLLVNVIRDC